MSTFEKLSTAELQQLAQAWREKALRGVKEARGQAHEHEAELRRRLGQGVGLATHANLDLRPLDQRERSSAHRPWWRIW
ncbi:hypothetical protein LJR039_007258 [Pseudorhodoferax sp. LjRoot39]|uniref:hypothetical protein n=1 Tax=Pseudorhodoferax sp. LjRoot39 TaxID=3342328 RepID=UPI003ECED56D